MWHGALAFGFARRDLFRVHRSRLNVQACRLIGCQNLKRYQGRRMDREEVQCEYETNKELGVRLGCWKAGMLVDNDAGDVAKELGL